MIYTFFYSQTLPRKEGEKGIDLHEALEISGKIHARKQSIHNAM